MRFSDRLPAASTGGRWLRVPDDIVASLGSRTADVRGTVNSTPFRSRLMIFRGSSFLGLTPSFRSRAGISVGDLLEVEIEPDVPAGPDDLPPELSEALQAHPVAAAAFGALTPSHRRRYANWVAQARRSDTRSRRSAQAVHRLMTQ